MCHLLAVDIILEKKKMCVPICICSKVYTYRAVQFSLAVHGKVKATVHPFDADESHS